MNRELRRRAREIFEEAVELPLDMRDEILDRTCAGDAALREEVESLLAAHLAAGSFLDDPVVPAEPTLDPDLADAWIGSQLGAYRILEKIGSGGMSTVYRAERADNEFRMDVAVKILKPGMDTEDVLRRFRTERQVLANLDHPNIARLIDAGATDKGRPFLVMDRIEGLPVDEYCGRHELPVPERLRVFLAICAAVQHAHQNLVVHRDLKPSNILVDTSGRPKLLDFGISKVLDFEAIGPADMTRTGYHVMTPRYASPEQIRGEAISTSTDVYSLGMVLYQLVTGSLPYSIDGASAADLQRIVCETEPTRPSGVSIETDAGRSRRRLPEDLDNIILKALQKEPSRRYASVERFADDIQRHLAGLPIAARPDTIRYRTFKFVRRNALAVVSIGVVLLVLIAASIVSTVLLFEANHARNEAEARRQTAENVSQFFGDMLASVDPQVARGRDVTILREVLDRAASQIWSDLGHDPEVAATLHMTIGSTYQNLALYDEAEEHLRAAISASNEAHGEGTIETSESLLRMGTLLIETSAYEEAEPLVRESLLMRRREYGRTALVVAEPLNSLGTLLEAINEAEEAEECFREALDIRRERLDDGHILIAASLSSLGSFLIHREAEAAGPYLREAVAIMRRHRATEPIQLQGSLHNLAGWHKAHGEYAAADSLYVESLEILRATLEPDHPKLAVTLNQYAALLEFRGDRAAAEPIYREALEIQRKRLGPRHRDVGTTLNNLAGLLRKEGRLEEARPLYAEAIEIYEETLAPDHAWVAIVMTSYCSLLVASEDYEEATRMVERCRTISKQYWAEDHWRIATIDIERATILIASGEFSEAEQVLIRCVEIGELTRGKDHSMTQRANARLVRLYEAWGRPEQAARHRVARSD